METNLCHHDFGPKLAFAKDEKNLTSGNLSYGQNVDTSVTTPTSSQLAALEPCIKQR